MTGSGGGSGSGGDPQQTLRTAGPPRLGGVLGRYELLQVLGHGAMATVFRARDTHLGREVAVKVMTLAVAARADSAERFRREAQAVAAVKHPGIVEIFDFVAAIEHEPAYIVSELIDGPTLRRFLDERRGRLLPEMAALLALPLAEALHAAHSRGVVHRDIKPDNVMIERGGTERRVVLTDFGIAHVTGLETMTATGALVGSPSYMSPEQARGDDVVPASDLFSFGVLLYEMATGHLPFTGKDPLMILSAISRGVYKRPSQISGFAGPTFDEICMRCLRPTAGERPASAGAVAEELRAFCRAAGLDPSPAALGPLIDDPAGFEAELRPRMANLAVAQARKHARRAELARALAELSRATAYVPGHAEATRLIATISSRRRWATIGAIAAGVLALAAGVSTVVPRLRRSEPTIVAAPPAVVETKAEAVTGPAPGGPGVAAPPVVPKAETVTTVPATGSTRPPRGKKPRAVAQSATGTAAPAAGGNADPAPVLPAAPSTSAPIPDEAPTVVEAPPPRPAPVAPVPHVTVEISAAYAFCDPAIDDQPAQGTPATFVVKAGAHRIFCTMPGGDRLAAGNLRIGPPVGGGAFRILLRKNGDKPSIDEKRTSVVAPAVSSPPSPPPATPAEPAD
jgi:tRNA A-37 threonylcarbamoyl transferase component Bud32